MMIQNIVIYLLLIPIINSLPSNSYYLINIDTHLSSNESYCTNIFTNDQLYRIPPQCHQHLLCDPYYCDDKSFRCIKIRETLCCLYRYFQSNCSQDHSNRMKDLFRSVYFQMSIEHGYCEINLERIEKIDQAYCIANIVEEIKLIPTTTTTIVVSSSTRTLYKHFHRRPSTLQPNRYRHRIAAKQNYSSLANRNYLRHVTIIEQNISSTCSRICTDFLWIIILFLSVLSK